jgi:hypothetical protein
MGLAAGGWAMGQTLHLGAPTTIESYADRTPYGAVFEDDGKLAYFYAVESRDGDAAVLDAVMVYEITSLIEHPTSDLNAFRPCDVRIVWSADQEHVALLLDGQPHAAFDFARKRAYCRTNFPAGSRWSNGGHAWEPSSVEFLESLSDAVAQPSVKFSLLP